MNENKRSDDLRHSYIAYRFRVRGIPLLVVLVLFVRSVFRLATFYRCVGAMESSTESWRVIGDSFQPVNEYTNIIKNNVIIIKKIIKTINPRSAKVTPCERVAN